MGSILLPNLLTLRGKSRARAVLFDMDGTLLDTLEDLQDSVNHVLLAHGYPARTREEIRAFLGNGAAMLLRHFKTLRENIQIARDHQRRDLIAEQIFKTLAPLLG